MSLKLKGDVGPGQIVTLWGWNKNEDTIYPVYIIDNGIRTASNIYAYDVANSQWHYVSLTPDLGDSISQSSIVYSLNTVSFLYGYDGSNFRRINVASSADATLTPSNSIFVISSLYAYDIANSQWHRIGLSASPSDTISIANFGYLLNVASVLYAYDGTDLRRLICDTSGKLKVNLENKVEGSSEGTTTDTESVVATIDLRNSKGTSIFIKNTGSSNDMDIKVISYVMYSGSISYTEKSVVVSPGNVEKINIENRQKVEVKVKSSVSGNSTTYRIEYLTY